MLVSAFAAGASAMGAQVHLVGIAPTPAVSYLCKSGGYDYGVMISASHNPFYDNGIKVFEHAGKLATETVALLEAYLDGTLCYQGRVIENLPDARGDRVGKILLKQALLTDYVDHMVSLFRGKIPSIRVGVDLANGATYRVAKRIYQALGIEAEWIHASPNGQNINAGCGSTHMESLQHLVCAQGLAVGFAFDGDGDRCLACDGDGREIDGDGILYLSALGMQKEGRLQGSGVVATHMSNGGLALSLKKEGIALHIAGVGDSEVARGMLLTGYSLGGEQSGHIIYGDMSNTGDGILTSLRILTYLGGAPLQDTLSSLVRLPQVMRNIPILGAEENPLEDEGVQEEIEAAKASLAPTGRILVRKSGTEPLLRVMVESESQEACERMAELLTSILKGR
jgi:phosphoglucosamine mutase